jgi:hypothetical protein
VVSGGDLGWFRGRTAQFDVTVAHYGITTDGTGRRTHRVSSIAQCDGIDVHLHLALNSIKEKKNNRNKGDQCKAGAYTRTLLSSTWAVSDTRYTLNTPRHSKYLLTPPKHPLYNT